MWKVQDTKVQVYKTPENICGRRIEAREHQCDCHQEDSGYL